MASSKVVEDIALRELVATAGVAQSPKASLASPSRRTSPLASSSLRLGSSGLRPLSSSALFATAPAKTLAQAKPNSPGPRSPTQIMRSSSPMGHFGPGETSLPALREVLDSYRHDLGRLHSEIATLQVQIDKANFDGLLSTAERLVEARAELEGQAADAQQRFDAQQGLCASLLPRSSFGLPSPRITRTH